MASKHKSTLILLLKIALAAGLIAFMVRSGHLDPKDLWALMTVQNVILAIALVGLNTAIAAWRWIILMRARGINISLANGFSLYLIGIFFNYALPGSVGGDVVRGYYLVNDYPKQKGDVILSLVIDRVLGLYSFFVLTLVAVVSDYEFVVNHEKIRLVASFCLFMFLGLTFFFTVTFSTRLSVFFGLGMLERKIPRLHKLVVGVQRFGDSPKTVAMSVAVSLMAQLVGMVFFYQIAVISGETDITWNAVMFAVPMGFLVTAIPIAPAGIGVGQVAFSYLFQAYLDKPTQVGATAITAFQLTLVCWAMVGAVFYLKRKRPKPEELERMAADQ
jgi:glycosyltransferase 2 family protein